MTSDSSSARGLARIAGPEDFAAAFDVSRETIARLISYERLLRQWQKAVNLVAPSTLDDVWHRHFADSAQLLALAPNTRTWVDLGSGAGFPGLVVAILLADTASHIVPSPLAGERQGGGNLRTPNEEATPTPNPSPQGGGEPVGDRGGWPRVTLIDSNARKCAFLREVVRQTAISDGATVEILSIRVENAATHATLEQPDVVSARALAPLDKLISLAAPLFAPHSVGLFLKGREFAAEVEAARRAWSFKLELVQSRTERDGRIAVISELAPQPAPNSEGLKP
jgi:16S rRNA (guanine527-N7)-methyltransferase